MSKFIIIEARKLVPFQKEQQPLEEFLVNTDKITVGYVDERRIWIRFVGEFQLEKAEWERVVKLLRGIA